MGSSYRRIVSFYWNPNLLAFLLALLSAPIDAAQAGIETHRGSVKFPRAISVVLQERRSEYEISKEVESFSFLPGYNLFKAGDTGPCGTFLGKLAEDLQIEVAAAVYSDTYNSSRGWEANLVEPKRPAIITFKKGSEVIGDCTSRGSKETGVTIKSNDIERGPMRIQYLSRATQSPVEKQGAEPLEIKDLVVHSSKRRTLSSSIQPTLKSKPDDNLFCDSSTSLLGFRNVRIHLAISPIDSCAKQLEEYVATLSLTNRKALLRALRTAFEAVPSLPDVQIHIGPVRTEKGRPYRNLFIHASNPSQVTPRREKDSWILVRTGLEDPFFVNPLPFSKLAYFAQENEPGILSLDWTKQDHLDIVIYRFLSFNPGEPAPIAFVDWKDVVPR